MHVFVHACCVCAYFRGTVFAGESSEMSDCNESVVSRKEEPGESVFTGE